MANTEDFFMVVDEKVIKVSRRPSSRTPEPKTPPIENSLTFKMIDGRSCQIPYNSVRRWEASSII